MRQKSLKFALICSWLFLSVSGCENLQTRRDIEAAAPAAPAVKVKDQNKLQALESKGGGLRKRVAILPFIDVNNMTPPQVLAQARENFMLELNRSGEFIAVDSNELGLNLESYRGANEYRIADIAKASQKMGVSAFLEAQVLSLGVKNNADRVGLIRQMKSTFESKARVRVVLLSGKETFNTIKTVTIDEKDYRVAQNAQSDRFFAENPAMLEGLLVETFLDFVPQVSGVLGKSQWEGRIATLQGDRVFLNVGRISGLNVGDLVRVLEEGQEIYDPQTGNFIGRSPGRMKGSLEVISYFGQDGAIAVIHSGSGFKENDRIEMY